MKNTLLLFLVSFFAIAQSQSNCKSERYLTEVFSGYNLAGGVYYGKDDPYGILTNQDLYLDVYMPAGDTLTNRPVIVHQYGGGYLIGWRSEPNIPTFAEMYTKRGFVFVSIDYRLGFNPLEGASAERAVYRGILDLRASLRFLMDNAATYGIDTNNIFLTGTSAGSISALGQTFMTDSDRPASTFGTFLEPSNLGCTNCTGNNNYGNKEVKIHGIINNWGAILDTSLIDIIDDPSENVPVVSFHGTADNAVMYVEGPPFSVPYFPSMQGTFLIHKRLDNIGIKNKLHPLVGFGHEPQLLNPNVTDTIVKYATSFLYEVMQGEISPIQGDSTVCLNDVNTYTLAAAAGSTYCWEVTGGTIISQNANTVSILWNTVGLQEVRAFELNYIEVTKPRTLKIQVAAPIIANINYSSNNGLFNFSGNFVANANYAWSFGDGGLGSNQFASHQYTNTGNYEVILEVSNQYCTANDTVVIVSDLCPIADFGFNANDSILSLTNLAQFYNNVYWNFGDGTVSNSDVNTHKYTTEGTFVVRMIVYNNFCTDTIEKTVTISFCAKADFDFTSNSLTVSTINLSSGNVSNFWNFGDGFTNGTFNPNHTYANSGTYDIQLIVFNAKLCSDTIIKTIEVIQRQDSIISSIHKVSEQNMFKVYPNPSSDIITISNHNSIAFTAILYSSEGKEISIKEHSKNASTLVLDISEINNGIYFLQIKTEDKIFIQKIFKQ